MGAFFLHFVFKLIHLLIIFFTLLTVGGCFHTIKST